MHWVSALVDWWKVLPGDPGLKVFLTLLAVAIVASFLRWVF